MNTFKEHQILPEWDFPVDSFIIDNLKEHVDYTSHWHDYIEIMFILEGTVLLQYNEVFFTASKSDMVIFHTGIVHSISCPAGEKGTVLVLQFLPALMNTSIHHYSESKYIHSFLVKESFFDFHILDIHKNLEGAFNIVMGLYRDFIKKERGYELYVKSCIYQLIVYLLRGNVLQFKELEINEEDLKKLDPLLTFIESNYVRDINLSECAKLMNFSYSYLSRFFKKVTGKSFKEYLDFIRIREAEKLILSQKMNISQAAFEVGFSNISCFNRVYKRVRSHSPSSLKRTKTAK